jgi:VWFA-related protein
MRRCLAILLLGLVMASAPMARQTPQKPPVFRAGVDAVLVDFTVVDGDGRFVRDLSRDDIEVLEDNRRQSITSFSRVDIPSGRDRPATFAGAYVDRDSVSNTDGDGRLYLIALDDAHLYPLRAGVAKAIARQFVERNLGVNDRAALVAMSGRYALAREFTGNRQQLLAAIDKLAGRFATTSNTGDLVDLAGGATGTSTLDIPKPMPLPAGANTPATMSAKATFRYLERLATWMGDVDGHRKSIVFISEGFSADLPGDRILHALTPAMPASTNSAGPSDVAAVAVSGALDSSGSTSVFDGANALTGDVAALRDVVAAAARANVSIYTIDPRGQPGGPRTTIDPGPNIDNDPLSAPERAARNVLTALADETGGFSLQHSNDFTAAYDRIVLESSSYYVLGYVSDRAKNDGKFRRIRVRARRPGLRVRARSGYVARSDKPAKREQPPAGWTDDHLTLINGPVPRTGLGLRVTAVPFRQSSSTSAVSVVVEAGGDDLKSVSGSAMPRDGFTIVAIAADPDGKVQARGHVRFERPSGISDAAVPKGVRFVSRMELKPGRYALRIAASDGTGDPASRGSVYLDLDVPDFSKGPVTMSGVAVTSSRAAERTTMGAASLADSLDSPVTASRVFERGDVLTTFARIYSNRKDTAINVLTSIQKPDGVVVFSARERVEAAQTSSYPGATHSARVPLRDLEAGDYLLTIEASAAVAGGQAARHVVFSVK